MKYPVSTLLIILICTVNSALGQDINDNFFKYHLSQKTYSIDSDASAVVLYEGDSMSIEMALFNNQISSGYQVHKVHKIIKILKSDATSAGNIVIGHTIDDLIGATYNLEGGKIVKTKLSTDDAYTKGLEGNLHSTNFSMPAIKEGSIIDYSYEMKTPLTGDFPFWKIQGQYPKLRSVYKVHFPVVFQFTSYSQSRLPFKEYSSEEQAEKDSAISYHIAKTFRSYNDITWVRRNIPAAKEEPYISCLENNIERLELQLTANGLDKFAIDRNDSWERFDQKIWPHISTEINGSDAAIYNVIDSINKSNKSELARTKAIYSYIRSNFTVATDEYNRHLLTNNKFTQKIFENKGGSKYDINLLLTTMLCDAGLKAAPVFLSTVGSLQAKELFPTIERFNYLISSVWIDSNLILLDASDKYNAFGCLPKYCYNGYARMLGKKGLSLMLRPDVIKEKMLTSIRIFNVTDTAYDINTIEKLGTYASAEMRKKWHDSDNDNGLSNYIHDQTQEYGGDINVLKKEVHFLYNPDTNLVITYTCHVKNDKPVNQYYMHTGYLPFKQNPFKSMKRLLPVEFPYNMDYNCIVTIQLPQNFAVDGALQPTEIDYQDKNVVYKKLSDYDSSMHLLSMNTRFTTKETAYPVEGYETLRQFFDKMIQKENEIIVLKKIGN